MIILAVFDIIPINFFSVLVSGNREIYVEALLLLHQLFQFNLNIRVDEYISALIELQENRVFTPEDDDLLPEGSLTPSGKARLILDRFIKTGWVEKDFLDGSFVEIITPQPYAISVLKLLSELEDGNAQEYNSLVFSTYSGLKTAKDEQETQMYEAILSAKMNTEQLEYQLRRLYHGIRGYLRAIETHSNVNELLQNHFESYKQMSDHIYHPIKTMDSIHRYMTPTQSILADVLGNDSLMQKTCERAMAIKKFDSPLQAEQEIVSNIDYILNAYQSLSGIINQIDRKHSNYTKSSIEKMRYLMTADQSIQGKLVELLKAYAEAESDNQVSIGNLMQYNIQVNRQEFLDGKSLYHKNIRSRRIDTPPLTVEKDNSFAERAMNDMMAHIKNGYSIGRVRRFVDVLLDNNDGFIESKDIPLQTESDFILLILSVIRANDRGMNYSIERKSGHVMCNGYQIPNMVLRKKDRRTQHVE